MKHALALAALAFTALQVPAGCTVTHVFEDHSAVALCDDGSRLVYDADGSASYDSVLHAVIRDASTIGWHEAQ